MHVQHRCMMLYAMWSKISGEYFQHPDESVQQRIKAVEKAKASLLDKASTECIYRVQTPTN